MDDHCQNPCCENPGTKEVPVSVRDPSDEVRTLCAPCEEAYTWGVQHGVMSAIGRLTLVRVDEMLAAQGFVVVARNTADPSTNGAFEAWAYTGPLDFEMATPVCFGIGTHCVDALSALDQQLLQNATALTPIDERMPLHVTRRELATILGALRFHQAENLQPAEGIVDDVVRDIATDGGMLRELVSGEIDELCERLNLDQRVPSVAQRIHDLLYFDMVDGREFYNPAKARDDELTDAIADIIAEYVPRPAQPDCPRQ